MKKKRLEQRIVKGQPLKLIHRLEMRFAESDLRENLRQKNDSIKLTESAGSGKRKLIVTVEGIHTGMTKNMTFYPGPTLEASTPTWTTPYRKPILKNHNEYAEPLGRIIQAEYVESILVPEKHTVRMKLEITDQDTIDKVLDGRYTTLSVGGSANKIICSTCGKDLVAEGFCGHWRGKKYEGKSEPTHWIIGEYTGDEISFVNVPADVYAQVIAAELVTGEGGDDVNKAKNAKGKVSEMSDLDLIGQLTESDQEEDEDQELEDDISESADDDADDVNDDTDGDEEDATDDAENNSADDDDGVEESDDAENSDDESLEEKVKRLEALVAEKDETIQSLTTRAEQAEAENASLTAQLSEANATIQSLQNQLQEAQQNLASAEEERNTFQEQNIRLARFSKKLLAERVVDLRIMQGKDKPEDRESLVESWMKSTPKVLESTIQDLLKAGAQRQVKQVTSPGLAIGEGIEGENGEITESTANKPKKAPTLADLEEAMVKAMTQRV